MVMGLQWEADVEFRIDFISSLEKILSRKKNRRSLLRLYYQLIDHQRMIRRYKRKSVSDDGSGSSHRVFGDYNRQVLSGSSSRALLLGFRLGSQ